MPTYEYECTQCGKVFELFQSITEKAKRTIETSCAECKNKAPVVRRIGPGAGVIFKGSGFYQTDYRSESYKKAAQAESGTAPKADGDGKAKSDSAEKKEKAAKKQEKVSSKAKTAE
jgi:putative FmdB family regulatory protein